MLPPEPINKAFAFVLHDLSLPNICARIHYSDDNTPKLMEDMEIYLDQIRSELNLGLCCAKCIYEEGWYDDTNHIYEYRQRRSFLKCCFGNFFEYQVVIIIRNVYRDKKSS
jgi:hypothetical protein